MLSRVTLNNIRSPPRREGNSCWDSRVRILPLPTFAWWALAL